MRAQLLHPWPSLATSIAALGFALVFGMRPSDARIAVIFITVLMTQLSISALNDWADRDRDAAAQRPRPVASGRIPPSVALGLAILFAIGVLPAALAFGSTAGIVLLVGLALAWAYDLWLKPTPLSFVPFAIAFPLLPIWVGLIAGRTLGQFAWLAAGGAFLAVAIHLADSLPDIASDAAVGVRNLAVMLGAERTILAIVVFLLAGALVVVVALVWRPLIAVPLGVAALITAALIVSSRERPQQARWVVGAYSIVASLALLAHAGHG